MKDHRCVFLTTKSLSYLIHQVDGMDQGFQNHSVLNFEKIKECLKRFDKTFFYMKFYF